MSYDHTTGQHQLTKGWRQAAQRLGGGLWATAATHSVSESLAKKAYLDDMQDA